MQGGRVGAVSRADALKVVGASLSLLSAGCGRIVVVAQAVGHVVAVGVHVLGGRDCRLHRLCALLCSAHGVCGHVVVVGVRRLAASALPHAGCVVVWGL